MKWIDTFRFGGADSIDPTEETVINIPGRPTDDPADRRAGLDSDLGPALDDAVKQRQISLAVEYAARTRTR